MKQSISLMTNIYTNLVNLKYGKYISNVRILNNLKNYITKMTWPIITLPYCAFVQEIIWITIWGSWSRCLVVEVVVLVVGEVVWGGRVALSASLVREPEVGSESSGLLQSLREHLVLLDVIVRDGPENTILRNHLKSRFYGIF